MAAGALKFAARRIAEALPVLFGVVVVTFLMTRALPGDPAAYFAGMSTSFEAIEQVRRNLGLDKPLYEQFFIYLEQLARGDLGVSLTTGRPVAVEIAERLPASLELTVVAIGLSALVAIPLGVLAATRPDGWLDHLCRISTTAGVSLPTFFTGLLLVFVFYYLLGWAPPPMGRLDSFLSEPAKVTGSLLVDATLAGDFEVLWAATGQMVLPAATMAIFTMAPLARMTRASMLAALSGDYVRTARALGLGRRRVLVTYALRNALLPVVTILGMVFSFALGANVLVEKVFAWPGIGSYALDALVQLDYAPVQGFVLTMATLYVLLNLVIDILYGLIDPRVAFAQ
jgi:peptide/nickel transport system permease protein